MITVKEAQEIVEGAVEAYITSAIKEAAGKGYSGTFVATPHNSQANSLAKSWGFKVEEHTGKSCGISIFWKKQ